jgi:hypothetical protein
MAEKHFIEQYQYGKYLLPYLKKFIQFQTVIELGCGEGGLLQFFKDHGFESYGYEKSKERIKYQDTFCCDATKYRHGGDMVILRDVIEHIPNKRELFDNLISRYIFVSFPPKWSAYAGHQQHNRFCKFIPFVHYIKHFPAMDTAISIREFERLITDFDIIDRRFYLLRPVFKIRWCLPVIRIFKNPWAMGAEYLLKRRGDVK